MDFHFAPVQGHTDAAYRYNHSQFYGCGLTYYTPFIRLEKGVFRPRDVKDFLLSMGDGGRSFNCFTVPQVIFRNEAELRPLVEGLVGMGAQSIDLNLGCPFPLQTGHGRGAAAISSPEAAEAVERVVSDYPAITFSVKMRLGLNGNEEWRQMMPALNKLRLSHISLHPRIAKQQYGGELDLEQFMAFLENSLNPVVFNGDIVTPEDIAETANRFSGIKGIMIGRGLLARPSLVKEYLSGEEMHKEERLARMLEFHKALFDEYNSVLCGDSQVLGKIKPFWEYAEPEIGRKAWKAIAKATNMAKYKSAVAIIDRNTKN